MRRGILVVFAVLMVAKFSSAAAGDLTLNSLETTNNIAVYSFKLEVKGVDDTALNIKEFTGLDTATKLSLITNPRLVIDGEEVGDISIDETNQVIFDSLDYVIEEGDTISFTLIVTNLEFGDVEDLIILDANGNTFPLITPEPTSLTLLGLALPLWSRRRS